MKPAVALMGLVLLAAACSKPTELASEANARYDERDAVVAAPPPGAEIDTTPIAPEAGTPEAEALMPADAEAAPGPPPDDIAPDLPPAEALSPPAAEPVPPPVEEGAPLESPLPLPLTPAEPPQE